MLIESIARLKYVSIPPRKMRLVANSIKGMPVEKALNILNFTPRIAAQHIARTLKSAAANALSVEGTDHLKPEDLMIKNIYVDAAPTQKRIRFQSMGRVFRYKKRFCHLTIELQGEVDEVTEVKTKAQKKSKKVKEEPAVKAKTAKKTAKKTLKKAPRKRVKTGKAQTKKKTTTSKTSVAKKAGK